MEFQVEGGEKFEQVEYETQRILKFQAKFINAYEGRIRSSNQTLQLKMSG